MAMALTLKMALPSGMANSRRFSTCSPPSFARCRWRSPSEEYRRNSVGPSPFIPSLKTATPKYLIQVASYISPPADFVEVHDSVDVTGGNFNDNGVREPAVPISWNVIVKLLFGHKMRLALSVFALFASTGCTLTMPILSGRLFEILVGTSSEQLWRLLCTMGSLYMLEPICTIIFITNMSAIWERVMATLRLQIFNRILIQKVEFFDRHKVGELTGLLTSDLGSLKDIVNENISRDRGSEHFQSW